MVDETKPQRPAQEPDNGALRYNTMIGRDQDPSALTTQQLLRENFWLRELLETRLNGMDRAILLLQNFADRTPTTMDIQHEVQALKEVTQEKFNSIVGKFNDGNTALSAALQAQEKQAIATNDSNNKAIAKMEDNFTKLIEQGRELQQTMKQNADVQLADIKSRLDKGEGRTVATTQVHTDNRAVVSVVIAGIIAFVVVITAVVSATIFIGTRAPTYLPSPPAAASK